MATYRNIQAKKPQATINLGAMDPVTEEKPVAVNGYQQVVEMLEAADPAFRESLLKRLASRDPELGRSLRAHFAQNRAGL
jgi:hypothetical protein